MRPTQMELSSEIDEQGGSMAMDVDDIDPIEVFGDGFFPIESKLTDTDFFNSFEDDFDDSDIN